MPSPSPSASRVEFHPLTPERWKDVEELFGERGACAGCWCMWWRLTRAEWIRGQGEGNRRAFRRIVAAGEVPGILAYAGGKTIGWCAIAPRERYVRLEGSRTLMPIDDEPVWSVVCFFVAKPFRRKGITVRLLKEGIRHARSRGARIVEGYPVEPLSGKMPDAFAFTGLPGAFVRAGFVEVARRSRSRPVMRWFARRPAPPRSSGTARSSPARSRRSGC